MSESWWVAEPLTLTAEPKGGRVPLPIPGPDTGLSLGLAIQIILPKTLREWWRDAGTVWT